MAAWSSAGSLLYRLALRNQIGLYRCALKIVEDWKTECAGIINCKPVLSSDHLASYGEDLPESYRITERDMVHREVFQVGELNWLASHHRKHLNSQASCDT